MFDDTQISNGVFNVTSGGAVASGAAVASGGAVGSTPSNGAFDQSTPVIENVISISNSPSGVFNSVTFAPKPSVPAFGSFLKSVSALILSSAV